MRKLAIPLLLALVGVGLIVGAALPLMSLFSTKSGASFVAPGETKVAITNAGTYTLWHESKTSINGTIVNFPDNLPSGTTIKVSKQPEGTDIPMILSGATYMESNGKRRASVGQFKMETPGDYTIAITGLPEKRAFYFAEARFLRLFMSGIGLGLTGVLFLFAAVGSGIYLVTRGKR